MTYEVYNDFDSNNPALGFGYTDAAIGPGTRLLYDAFDPNCYPGLALPAGALPAGTLLNNLVNEAAEITVDAGAFPILGSAGFVVDAVSKRLLLPASVKVSTRPTDLFIGIWIKPAAQVLGAGQFASPCSHITGGTGDTTDWTIQNSAAAPTTYSVRFANSSAAVPNVVEGSVAFVGMRGVVTGGSLITTGYLNGVAVGTSPNNALPSGEWPFLGGIACLGQATQFAGPGWRGQIGRFIFQDFSAAGAKSFDQFMAAEMKQGAGRFA